MPDDSKPDFAPTLAFEDGTGDSRAQELSVEAQKLLENGAPVALEGNDPETGQSIESQRSQARRNQTNQEGSQPQNQTPALIEQKAESFRIQGDLNERFGVRVRQDEDGYEFYFRAGGKDNVVLETPESNAALRGAGLRLENLASEKIETLEKDYGVTFMNPGVTEIRVNKPGDEGFYRTGDFARSMKPNYPQIFALEEALKRSTPSQKGVKFSFLDRRTELPSYGDKPTLGFYQADRGGAPCFYVTPAGAKLAPTLFDNPEVPRRSLQWCIMHELTHNSQKNMWGNTIAPDSISYKMGWRDYGGKLHGGRSLSFMGNGGELFGHGSDSFDQPTMWFARNFRGEPVNSRGKSVSKISDAQHFTNEEVMEKAMVPPFTYYFKNPTEMLSEGLTAFRHGGTVRKELLDDSPRLYQVVKNYDQEEIDKYFGTDLHDRSKFVRDISGEVILTDPNVIARIREFENRAEQRKIRAIE